MTVSGRITSLIKREYANFLSMDYQQLCESMLKSPIKVGDKVIGCVTNVDIDNDVWYGVIYKESVSVFDSTKSVGSIEIG